MLPFPDIEDQQEGFFKLPITLPNDDFDDPFLQYAEQSTGSQKSHDSDSARDVWLEAGVEDAAAPSCKTWEDFNDGLTLSYRPMFISEAGSAAYDRLLAEPEDFLNMKNAAVPVVEHTAYFSALLQLALAQNSRLFRREPNSTTFVPVLGRMRIAGYSSSVIEELEKDTSACGKAVLDLSSFAKRIYNKRASRCVVAFASAIKRTIQLIQEAVTLTISPPKSILQLQHIIRNIAAVLRPLCRVSSNMNPNSTDEEMLTILYNYASLTDNDESYARDISKELLQTISQSWIEFMEEWMGTTRETGVLLSKANVGSRKGFVTVASETRMDDFGREVEDVDYRLLHSALPEFLPNDIAQSLFQAGRNLRFIRSFHPTHALARQETIISQRPPKMQWVYRWADVLELVQEVKSYRERLVAAIANQDTADVPAQMQLSDTAEVLQFFGASQDELERRFTEAMQLLSQPAKTSEHDDAMGDIIMRRLVSESSPIINADEEPHWTLLPALSFGSLALTQAQVIGRECIKLLFDNHDLLGHLQLQRSFQLLGNGMFCSRLSHALFDPDLEASERQRGVAREGGVMGLRLGGRETWPPASSELRLALMGVLKESHMNQTNSTWKYTFRDTQEMPGDLSFAVRDLSDEEITKCLDADSLEALDFLRLSYISPPELQTIITPMNLLQYDKIFKLLLRVLRMQYVTNFIFRDVNLGWGRFSFVKNVRYRFVREAHHAVSCIAAYFLDIGVAGPWASFERSLASIRLDLEKPFAADITASAVIGPAQIQELHGAMLQQITQNLFLRKRQAPILELVEGMFTCILKYANYIRLEDLGRLEEIRALQTPDDLYKDLKQHIQMFLVVCRQLLDKAKASSAKKASAAEMDEQGISGAGNLEQLIAKLDLYEYYTQ